MVQTVGPEAFVVYVHRYALAEFILVDDDLFGYAVKESCLIVQLLESWESQSGNAPMRISGVIARAL